MQANSENGILHAEETQSITSPYIPVAVCGMALRVPGSIHDPSQLWDMLINKGEGRSVIPPDRFSVNGFYSKYQPKQGTVNFKHGYFLEDGLHHFDAGFFSMSRREVERLDPQQRLLLEVVHECMESAGEVGWRGKNIGCMVGSFGQDWSELSQSDKLASGLYTITGQGDFLLANRVSFEYDLKGPSLTVKTACSSAAVAFHLACNALARGECDGVIVGGTSVFTAPGASVAMTEQGLVSPEGRSKPFDASADGYARAEAINAVFLRRLDDALRDGAPVRAVVRGTALNCDGKSASLASPSAEAHESLIRKAYAAAGLSEVDAPYVECHGTGTKVGDPLEAAAIASVFGKKGTYLGSIKANIGHSEGASFITSLIKAVLTLEKKVIPPNIHFANPNPKIPFEVSKLRVPLEPTPWPKNRAERASINSFGLGGANAHVILDSASSVTDTSLDAKKHKDIPSVNGGLEVSNDTHLLILSANHQESLDTMAHNIKEYRNRNPNCVYDLAYTLAMKRDTMRYRTCILMNSGPRLDSRDAQNPGFPNFKTTSPSPVSFVFTGQGAQWPQMGQELFGTFPTFEKTIAALDQVLQSIQPKNDQWSIRDQLLAPSSESRVDEAEFSQPLCTAVQIGLTSVLRELGVLPDSVVGHSSGEIAAAYASGAITAANAIKIAYLRGRISKSARKDGAMLAIGMGSGAVAPFLVDGAVVACENSSTSVTVSGDEAAVDEVAGQIRAQHPHVLIRRLRVQQAYHSHHMKDCGQTYYNHLSSVLDRPTKPQIPFYSSTCGSKLASELSLDERYWRSNLECPVRFDAAVRGLLKDMTAGVNTDTGSSRLLLEIGPHSALAGPLRQILRDTNSKAHYLPSLVRHRNAQVCLLESLGHLWIRSVPIRLATLFPTRGRVLTDLPPYPWYHKESFWEENRVAKQWRFRKEPPHEILGSPVLEWNETEPTWRNLLSVEDVHWLRDHRIGKDTVFPAAGYISMVGEAIRQLGGGCGFSMRNVVVENAMVVNTKLEVMTVLRRAQLTTSQVSDWYDFHISSYNGSAWIRHCWGQALNGRSDGWATPETSLFSDDLPTTVDSHRWYKAMGKVGLNYSGPFHSLADIRSHPNVHQASGTVQNHLEPAEERYQLHPATIDNVFQLFTVASAHGQPRSFKTLAVPTFIEHIYVDGQSKGAQVHARVTIEPTSAGGMLGGGVGVVKDPEGHVGAVTFEVSGLKASPVDGDYKPDSDPHAAVQLEWKPLLKYVEVGSLMRTTKKYAHEIVQLEKLFVLSAAETLENLVGIRNVAHQHMAKFLDWLQSFISQVEKDGSQLFENAGNLLELTVSERRGQIEALYEYLLGTEMRNYAIAVNRIRLVAREIVEGTAEPLDILMEDDNLHKIYDFLSFWDYDDFLQLLGHNKPTLKVLEIGAGTGGTTGTILKGLRSEYGERLYSKYTYTDISTGFFSAAKQRFKDDDEAIEYKVLDISKDPLSQGFEEGAYDLIVAANVLHATPNLNETLSNVKKLLNTHSGRLLLQELNPAAKCVNFIFGILPGWWLGAEDERPIEPYVSPDRWRLELQAAGFNNTDVVIYDNHPPFQINATILASVSSDESSLTNGASIVKQKVTFVHGGNITPLQHQYAQAFGNHQIDVSWQTFLDQPPPDESIVVVLELETPFLHAIEEQYFNQLITWVASLQPGQRVFWLTRCTQMGSGADPRFAVVLGLARNIRSESSVAFHTIEIDEPSSATAREIVARLCKDLSNQERQSGSSTDPDFEFAICNGVPHISRFHWISVRTELQRKADAVMYQIRDTSKSIIATRLEIRTPGLLQTLQFTSIELPALRPNEVLIKVSATGMNFKDLLIAMGIVDTPTLGAKDAAAIGIETAGKVEAVGSSVSSLHPGDRVMAVSTHCFASYVISQEATCVAIPDELDFVEAATMPCVYATVIRALIDVGHIQRDQTVLIHSACGGVGIAAIQVCQMVGAKILATAGTPEKRRYLAETFHIPTSDIFNSRDPSFFPDVMRATNGRGVDLCLNSLSGELLQYSWLCVAEFGTLLEIGKRDLVGRGKLSLAPFEDSRTYAGIDLSHIFVRKPELWKSLLTRIIDYYRSCFILPIAPVTVYPTSECQEMFRFMQKGSHIGKVVLEMSEDPQSLADNALPTAQGMVFKSEASYLITGGLGGLGKSTARWMVENGARYLLFLSRRGMTPSTSAFFTELEASGCSPILVAGSVEDQATVRLAAETATRPIAGVIHGAMVLKDHATRDMPYNTWLTVMGPRVTGAWNLHDVFLDAKLDFFILLGSFSGMVGQPGQANYSASNTFLNSFVQYRQGLNLPASVLEMGPISDVGYVAESPAILENMKAMSTYAIGEQEYLEALQLAMIRSHCGPSITRLAYTNPAVIGVGLRSTIPLDDPNNRLVWRRDIRLSIYRNLETSGDATGTASISQNDVIKKLLSADKISNTLIIKELAIEVGRVLCGFLMKQDDEIVLDKPLSALGVDSLVSIELRNWCRQHLNIEVSVLEIMQSSLENLAQLAVEHLHTKQHSSLRRDDRGMNGTLPEERDKYDHILEVKVP